MCGVHGLVQLANLASAAQCAFVRDGFVAGSLRGMDSSGIFQLDKKFKAFIHKKAIAGPDFVYTKMAERFIKDADVSRLTVCHVRHATAGKVEEDNAHPFTANCADGKHWLVGVHNGTLDAGWKNKVGASEYTVDSEWALSHIALKGHDAFKDFKGSWCFVWWDGREKDKFFMCRNEARPMNFRLSKDKKQMFFASEAGMLAWLTERNDVKPDQDIYIVEPNKIYEFDLSKQEVTWSKVDMPKPAVYSYTPPSSKPATSSAASIAGKIEMERFLSDVKKAASGARDLLALELVENDKRKAKDKLKLSVDEKEELVALVDSLSDVPEVTPIPLVKPADTSPLDLSDLDDLNGDKTSETTTERIIREVAEAVSEGLDDPDPTTGTTGGSLEAAENGDWVADVSWYDSSLVSTPEQATAAFWNLTGEVHWFHGTSYDPDTETVYGEVRDYIAGQGHVEYTAIIRGVKAREAHARYINNRDPVSKIAGDYAVVVGVNEDPVLGRVFIMCELSAEGTKQYKKKAN